MQQIISGKIQAISNNTKGIMINSVWYQCPEQILNSLKRLQEITFTTDGKNVIGLLPNDKPFVQESTLQERIFKGQCLNMAEDLVNSHILNISDTASIIKQIYDLADKLNQEGKLRGYLK